MVAVREPDLADTSSLRARRAALETSLSDGWRAIDAAIAAGQDVALAEQRWLHLLNEYIRVCDTLQPAAQRAAGVLSDHALSPASSTGH